MEKPTVREQREKDLFFPNHFLAPSATAEKATNEISAITGGTYITYTIPTSSRTPWSRSLGPILLYN